MTEDDSHIREVITKFWGSLDRSAFDRELTELCSRYYDEGGRLGPLMGELLARAIGTMVVLTYSIDKGPGRETLLAVLKAAIQHTYEMALKSAEDAAEVARSGGLQ